MPIKNHNIKLKCEVEQKKRSGGKLGGGSKVRAKQAMTLSRICLYIYKITNKVYVDRYIHTCTSRKTVLCFTYTAVNKSKDFPTSPWL